MVKRSLEETTRNGVESLILEEPRASKKSRKEKKTPKVENPATAVPIVQDGDGEDKPSLSKEERKEKRRLKRERRALKESTATTDTADTAGNVQAATGAEADKTDDKAARKAEKARLKEIKRAKKNGTLQSKAESNGSSKPAKANGSSNGTSNGLSSAPTSAYTASSALAALPQSTIDTFLSTNHITITDPLSATNVLRPIVSFAHLPSNPAIKGNPFAQYTSPTPIQAAAWPFLLSGRDVIGVAETGSGKTLAFALPCVTYITSLLASSKRKSTGPLAVIVSPTRELACQIDAHISALASLAGLSSVCIYGGVPKPPQRDALRTASIVVATPGRLNDLLSEGATTLSSAGYVVLDEADRMLDTGFEDAIRLILSSCAPSAERQTLMFTATWPPSIRALASTFLKSPIKIAIGADNPTGDLRANVRITQTVEVVDPRQKETRLLQLLRKHQPKDSHDRVLVFCLYKKEATRIELFLRSNRIRVAAIHGDLSQAQRTASLDAFKSGTVPVLVATDVAARGLDIPEVKAVINVTFPLTVEDYVHRIGRTGRAGKAGLAVTMFTEHDKAQSGALINVLKAAKQPVPDELLKFGTTVKKKGHEAYGAFYKDPGVGEVKEAKKIKFDD